MKKVGKITGFGILAMILAAFATLNIVAMQPKYNFEEQKDFYFFEGCPYSSGAMCQWRSQGFSGFDIGMSKSDFLKTICNGNKFGQYFGPLYADKKPDFKADSRVSQWEPLTFSSFPCSNSDEISPYRRFTFERTANDWELKFHREIFGVVFNDNKLSLIQVHRSFLYVDP